MILYHPSDKPNYMSVSRISPLTKKWNTMELKVTPEQMQELTSPGRRMIQQIFPELSAPEREFLLTGHSPEDWKKIFGAEDTSK
jgi:hypothetical protein